MVSAMQWVNAKILRLRATRFAQNDSVGGELARYQFLYPPRHGDQQKKLFRMGNFPGFTLDIPILSGYNKFGIVYAGGELPPVFHG